MLLYLNSNLYLYHVVSMATTLPQNLIAIAAMNRSNQAESSDTMPDVPKDLLKLKEISDKLNLSTRRPSVVQWKQIIESRKSRGLYVTSAKPQYLDVSSTNLDCNNSNQIKVGRFKSESPLSEIDESYSLKFDVHEATGRHRRNGQIITPDLKIESKSGDVTRSYTQIQQLKETKTKQTTEIDGKACNGSEVKSQDTASRYKQLNQSINNLRRDLILMRIEDNKLARKLLNIRSEMSVLRAQYSWLEHADMLDDVTFDLLEEEELTGLIKACDLSSKKPDSLFANFSPLRSIGLNKMNLNSRRFSIR